MEGARCKEGLCKKPIPVVRPTPSAIGPPKRPRLADSFPRLGQARGASPGSLDQRSEEWPLCEGKCGALGVRLNPAPSEGGRELRGPHGRLSSALPRGGGEPGGWRIGAVGEGSRFRGSNTCLSGRGLRDRRAQWRTPNVFPSSLEAASRQRVEDSSAYVGLRDGDLYSELVIREYAPPPHNTLLEDNTRIQTPVLLDDNTRIRSCEMPIKKQLGKVRRL